MVVEARRCRIVELLGKGGFGAVYRAELLGAGGFRKPVALKILNADVANNEDIVQRLRDEARMLGLVRHSSIVHADALVQLDGRWTLVMEHVPGVGLNELVGRCFGHLDEVLTSDPFSVLASIPRTAAWLIVPTAVTAALAAAAIGFAQNGFRFYPKMLEPKFDRIDPIGRLKQRLNPKNASF